MYICILLLLRYLAETKTTCQFQNVDIAVNDTNANAAIEKLKTFVGKRYSLQDPEYPMGRSYQVGICTPAVPNEVDMSSVGAIRFDGDPTSNGKRFYNLGSLDLAKIIGGSDWVLLEYDGGKYFGYHCGEQEHPRVVIMIKCDETALDTNATMVALPNRYTSPDCVYLFELRHAAMCPQIFATQPAYKAITMIYAGIWGFVCIVWLLSKCRNLLRDCRKKREKSNRTISPCSLESINTNTDI